MRLDTQWSLRTLFLGLFAVATLCLTIAIGYAIWNIEQLTRDSENLLTDGVRTTRLADGLGDRITDIERTALQFAVVRSTQLLELFEGRRAGLHSEISRLEAYSWELPMMDALSELRIQIDAVARGLADAPAQFDSESLAFRTMHGIVADIRTAADVKIDLGLGGLQDNAARLYRALIILAVIAIMVMTVLAASFVRLVTGPVRQISDSIQALGQAEFDTAITVRGSNEFVGIGDRLDWLRERLKMLETQKSTFVRHVSHDLKTPLASIREGADLLFEECSSDVHQQELAGIVRDNALRLHELIEELLEYAGWQDVEPELYPTAVALHDVVQQTLDAHALQLQAKELHVLLESAPVTVTGDARRLHTLVDNLVTNAIKYAPTGSELRIALKNTAEQIELHVQDEGPGVPLDERERVFEPFFRGEPPPDQIPSGTGIGLALAKIYAVAHGGSIEIIDNAATGAHFRVLLPKD
ncbi:MAG: HAMP domain-containing sensor histidine kinase [Pseudomonadales bacterium]